MLNKKISSVADMVDFDIDDISYGVIPVMCVHCYTVKFVAPNTDPHNYVCSDCLEKAN